MISIQARGVFFVQMHVLRMVSGETPSRAILGLTCGVSDLASNYSSCLATLARDQNSIWYHVIRWPWIPLGCVMGEDQRVCSQELLIPECHKLWPRRPKKRTWAQTVLLEQPKWCVHKKNVVFSCYLVFFVCILVIELSVVFLKYRKTMLRWQIIYAKDMEF